MGKQFYIEQELQRILKSQITFSLKGGALLIVLFGVLDYLVTPDNFPLFLLYRSICSFLLLVLYIGSKKTDDRHVQNAVVVAGTAIAAITIEVMILSLGGHRSPYFAGMMLVMLTVLGFIPLTPLLSASIACLVYSIYLFPILAAGPITDKLTFITNNAFILATAGICLVWRIVNQGFLLDKINMQCELEDERSKLREYSSVLKEILDERSRALKKSETMFMSLFRNANDGIMIRKVDGIIMAVNQRVCEIHGYDDEEMKGMSVYDFILEENRAIFRERQNRLLQGEALLYETTHRRKDGGTVDLEVSTKAFEINGEMVIQSFHRDITEKKRLQAQLLHFQKVETIGTLAGGIAHDFKNSITVILSFAELILQYEEAYPEVASYARIIEQSARKASLTVSRLLSFARKDTFKPEPFQANSLLRDTITIFSKLIKKNIEIREEFTEPLPPIVGDTGQIEQVIMNLLINARDAMMNGGELIIRTSHSVLDTGSLSIPALIRKGDYIHITIEDQGAGISEENLPHIFKPFFTTKEKGHGTGLGLAIVYGIIKDHNGYITVDSTKGKGTVFDIYLPASSVQVICTGEEEVTCFKGPETILIVDDEIALMQPIREFLLGNGYDVIVCDAPAAGLEIFKSSRKPIDLVITDIVMPGMDGFQFTTRLKGIKPDLKVIFMSGYDVNFEKMPNAGFLRKPFLSAELVRMVRDVLDKDRGAV